MASIWHLTSHIFEHRQLYRKMKFGSVFELLVGIRLRENASNGQTNRKYGRALKTNAAVNGHLELTLLKVRQRFDAISTSNLEVYKFRDWWILTYFIFGLGESSPNNIWSMVNLERMFVLLFYYFFLCESESSPRKNKSAWWIFTHDYFRGGKSWPNYFGKEVNWWWILT